MEHSSHIHQRKNGGKVFTERYNPQRIERLKSIVKDFYQQGQKKRYCILVDGEMVVSINADARNFDGYKRYLEGHTESIEVRMFFGDSPNCNRHIFQTNQGPLAGVPDQTVEQKISEALEKQRILNELDSLKKELKRKDEIIEEYQEMEEEMGKKQLNINELLDKGFQLYTKFNANKNGSPAPTQVQGLPQSEVEVHSEPETESERQFQKMQEKHSEEELLKGLKAWRLFAKHPELKKEFTDLLNSKTKKDGEA
jgi:hypothetical protein